MGFPRRQANDPVVPVSGRVERIYVLKSRGFPSASLKLVTISHPAA